jgi:hypothetical protein
VVNTALVRSAAASLFDCEQTKELLYTVTDNTFFARFTLYGVLLVADD